MRRIDRSMGLFYFIDITMHLLHFCYLYALHLSIPHIFVLIHILHLSFAPSYDGYHIHGLHIHTYTVYTLTTLFTSNTLYV
jgi:hypothetical protein